MNSSANTVWQRLGSGCFLVGQLQPRKTFQILRIGFSSKQFTVPGDIGITKHDLSLLEFAGETADEEPGNGLVIEGKWHKVIGGLFRRRSSYRIPSSDPQEILISIEIVQKRRRKIRRKMAFVEMIYPRSHGNNPCIA